MVSNFTSPVFKVHSEGLKELIVSFVNPKSILRVVIATVAFGMGLDCPCVREIIDWGPSEDIDMYVQEIGHAGRDGELSVVTFFLVSIRLAEHLINQ